MKEGTVFLVVTVPKPWPHPTGANLHVRHHGNSRVQIRADAGGRLILSLIAETNSEEVRYTFQPLLIRGSGRLILGARWSSVGADLWINGQKLQLDSVTQGQPFLCETSTEEVTHGLILGDVVPGLGRSDADRLFVETLLDIDQKVESGTPYNLIRAAGLLRQLFLDATPLVNEVNRSHRIRLSFESIDASRDETQLIPDYDWCDPDASGYPGSRTKWVNLQAFLKIPCLKNQDRVATVADVIKACANAKGGIHRGIAKSPMEQAVVEFDDSFQFGTVEPSTRTIAGICRVALRGLRPLISAIAESSARATEPEVT